ncbi:MAG: plasmid pRiA4b family protein [Mucilaginibacter sp.]|nr:plasmid pRiA4b family protein [Mucilaginibacter sp.]
MKEAIQIKISLDNTSPVIWREILVPKNYNFYKLHHCIQVAMGWTTSHLFEFIAEGYKIGILYESMDDYDESNFIDSRNIKLMDLIQEPGETFKYEYDFGDGWEHTVSIEQFVTMENEQQLPICIGGELKCPPEDCGGYHGYYNFLSIMSNKHHPEYKETKMWFGGKYDSNEFNQDKVNKKMKNINRHIRSIDD